MPDVDRDVNKQSAVPHKSIEYNPDIIDFSTFKVKFDNYLTLNKITDVTIKRALLVDSLSPKPLQTLISLCIPKTPREFSYEELISKLENNYKKVTFRSTEMFNFFTTKQITGQSIQDFANKLRDLSANCRFPEIFLDDALITAFTMGLQDNNIRIHILQENQIEFNKTIEKAKVLAGLYSTKQCNSYESHNVNYTAHKNNERRRSNSFSSNRSTFSQNSSRNRNVTPCHSCGGNHLRNNCKFRTAVCNTCNKSGHISRVCGSNKKGDRKYVNNTSIPRKNSTRNSQQASTSRDTSYNFDVFTMNTLSSTSQFSKFMVPIEINGHIVKLELDTGSCATIVSENIYNKLGKPYLNNTSTSFISFSGHNISLLGEQTVSVKYKNRQAFLKLYFASGDCNNLLGRDWIDELNLTDMSLQEICNTSAVLSVSLKSKTKRVTFSDSITSNENSIDCNTNLQDLLTEFSDVFNDDLGHCTKVKVHLQLKPSVQPTFCRARPLPLAMQKPVEEEIDRLVSCGVLEPIDFSEWAAPIVPVRKPSGKLRICADFSTGLNKSLNIHQYPLPTPESIFSVLNGGKHFSVLDFSEAYFQLELDEESKKLLVINTHKGLFRYNRLAFGVASAPAIYEKVMDQMLSGLPGVAWYLDDIICTGSTDQEHISNLRRVLARIKSYNFRIKLEKSTFFAESVQFLGMKIDKNGIHKTEEKIKAIVNMPPPTDLKSLQSFLGMVNYYAKFIPNLADLCYPLNLLRKKNVKFIWSDDCERAFKKIKACLTSEDYLAHFNPNLPLILACDASSVGVGCTLFHRFPDGSERAIAFASKTLKPEEQKYAQIEREGLSIIYGVRKFYKYLWAHEFILQTDHKPLLTIFGSKKGIPTTTANRLQRWALILMGYTYKIEYIPTEKFGYVDGLSRLPAGFDEEFDSKDFSMHYVVSQIQEEILADLPVDASQVATETCTDKVLKKVKEAILTGWPTYVQDSELQPYFNKRNELSVHCGCILWGIRTVIPPKFRQNLLNYLHATHQGIVRMKSEARRYFWWPNLDNDIEIISQNCTACSSITTTPQKVPLNPWPVADFPWKRIHIDFAGPFLGKMFLLVIDAHSKWPEIIQVKDTTSSTTIQILKSLFVRYGICDEIISDNGTSLTSGEFQLFCKKLGIKHVTIPAYHAQSNGQAERNVQTFKNSIKKIIFEKSTTDIKEALQNFLFRYRSTPHSTTNVTPSELFLKRQMKTTLDLLHPNASSLYKNNQDRYTKNFNKRTKEKHFYVNQRVLVKEFRHNRPATWTNGVIVERQGYRVWIVDINGRKVRRHSNQLKIDKSSDKILPLLPPVENSQEIQELPSTSSRPNNVCRRSMINLRPRNTIRPPEKWEPTN